VGHLDRLVSKYGHLVNFLCVYIMEAHALDQWPLGKYSTKTQHKTLQDRLEAAKQFQQANNFKPTLVVDEIDNNFNSVYAAWPERGWIILEGKISYISDPKLDGSIDWETGVMNWLEKFFS